MHAEHLVDRVEVLGRQLDEQPPQPLRLDVAQHYHRPSARLPAGGQNFVVAFGGTGARCLEALAYLAASRAVIG